MNMFNSKGMIKIPRKKKQNSEKKDKRVIIKECYCPNGHSLISNRVQFKNMNGISLKVESVNGSGVIFLSPICGDKSKISLDIDLVEDEVLNISCPECSESLAVYGPCSCGENLIALFGDKKLSFSNCIGICNKVGCSNSMIKTGNELRRCSMLFL